jgi:hypothetical protein
MKKIRDALLCWHHMCLEEERRRFYRSHMMHAQMQVQVPLFKPRFSLLVTLFQMHSRIVIRDVMIVYVFISIIRSVRVRALTCPVGMCLIIDTIS